MIKNKQLKIILFLLLLVILASLVSILVGAVMINPIALFTGEENTVAYNILLYSRIPRTCCSLFAGAALALAGAIIQSVLSNPLAAPNIIGVNSGAGFMVACSMAFFPYKTWSVPIAAFIGALLIVFIILAISEYAGASKMSLVLAGVAISGMFSGATDAIITFKPDALKGYTDFKIGGFRGITMERLYPAAICIIIGIIIVIAFHHEMDILSLGSETAQSLGLKVKKTRTILLFSAALLAGAAVSFSGILSFVGLLVPHVVRKLLGNDSITLIIGSILGGAFLVTVCDTIARSLFSPFELPVGIILSLLGAPFFLWILLKDRKHRI